MVPPNELLGEDNLFWRYSTNGCFTVKSAYFLIEKIAPDPLSKLYKAIWKWRGVERIRVFLWLVVHNRLPTNVRRHNWSNCPTLCLWCKVADEDILHVLRDCGYAKSFWRQVIKPSYLNQFFTVSLQDWMHLNLHKDLSRNSDKEWNLLWGVAVWKLWTWRNHHIFKPNFVKPNDPALIINAIKQNFVVSLNLADDVDTITGSQTLVSWSPPPLDYLKLNVDGAVVNGDGLAGCGGVLRYSNGSWLGGFSQFLGICTAREAEEWAILKGLELAWSLGYKRLIVASDAKDIVDSVNKGTYGYSGCSALEMRISLLLQRPWSVTLCYSSRQANAVADLLAKHFLSR